MRNKSRLIKQSMVRKRSVGSAKGRRHGGVRQQSAEGSYSSILATPKLKEHAKEIVRDRGLASITVDDLVQEITPRGRGSAAQERNCPSGRIECGEASKENQYLVPDTVKRELLAEIKRFLAQGS
ncbi:unnamed protein product, partial [Meganyctiphanes norvegica]